MKYRIGQLVEVPASELVVGPNVRVDTHPDAKEFAASIKTRGVLQVIDAYVNDDGDLAVERGQRRTIVAAKVGTPTGTVPVRIKAAPTEADRITDQMVENLHRADMRPAEVRDGIEQLALAGVSPAQIAKRTATQRATVNAALAVTSSRTGRDLMDTEDLTLDQAAILAEFEDDDAALEELRQALSWRRPLEHTAQRLRDRAAENAAIDAEVDRLRGDGLPVLDRTEWDSMRRHVMEDLRDDDDQPVPPEQWPEVTGAAVVLEFCWRSELTDDSTDSDAGEDEDGDEDGDEVEDEPVWVPVWVCIDPAAAGLHHRFDRRPSTGENGAGGDTVDGDEAAAERAREARREQRRLVIANNKAWDSAQVVRQQWLGSFLARKSAPAGAEALVCEAITFGHHSLRQAMERRHGRLCSLLGLNSTGSGAHYGNADALGRLLAKATTPKAATMLALACVLAAWEDSTSRNTWRSPTTWDARVMTALTGWGYQPSDVEALLTGTNRDVEPNAHPSTDTGTDTGTDADTDARDAA